MNQRLKRELEFSVKLLRLSPRARHAANTTLHCLPDNQPDIIITRHLSARADEYLTATGQRLFVRQIATGIYRRLADDRGQATTLGIFVAASFTVFAISLISSMVFFFSDVPDPATRNHDFMLFSIAAVVVFLIYGAIWLRIGVQTIQRLRLRRQLA